MGLGIGLSLALLLAVGMVASRGMGQMIETSRLVTHTHSVLERLADVRSQISSYESSGRGYALTGEESFLDSQALVKARIAQDIKILRDLTLDNPAQQRRLETLEQLVAHRIELRDELVRGRREQGLEGAADRAGASKRVADTIGQLTTQMENEERDLLALRDQQASETVSSTEQVVLGATVAAFLLVGVLGFFISRDIAQSVASRDALLQGIRDATMELGSASAELLAATTQQGSGAHEQAAAISQTTTTADEVTQTAEQAAQRSRTVAEVSQRMEAVAQSGKLAVEETARCIGELRGRVEGIAKSILLLSESAQSIGDLITTVNDLAEQSNILALNAAIEASRAGEHGRGFAVVATEVRTLAEHSKKATKQVRELLGDIQRQTNKAVLVTEEGTKGADEATRAISQAGETFRELADSVANATQAALQVAASAGQQALGISQIQQAMKDINQVTVQSLAATRQIERASQDLSSLSTRLSQMVGAPS